MTNNFQRTIDWYDKNAGMYSKKLQSKIQLEALKKFVSYLPENIRILDAGCAAGRDSSILDQLGCSVTGVDLSMELLKIAKKENSHIEFVKANFLNLPFSDETFGGIWASASLIHFETKKQFHQALKEFWRVLVKDGILYFSVKMQLSESKTTIAKDSHSKEGRFTRFFNHEEIQQVLKKAKFNIIESFDRKSTRGKDIKWLVVYAKKE